ncbi:MAG: acetyl-mannosamine transferase [Candidatus Brocadia sp. UTAMX2]|nr:MAG: acetyl-mannosamine transferase [Candidatus Brocadia sp. UTAMX2]
MDKINICDVEIDNVSLQDSIKTISKALEKEGNIFITTPNVHHIVLIQKDKEFKKIYQEASLVLADGMPIVWASKFLGTPLKEKVSGSDLVPVICKFAAEKGYRLFFLGGRLGAVEKARENLIKMYPQIKIVGVYSPPFGFENNREENEIIIKMIQNARPEILLVGLGAPKQEKWIYRHYKKLDVPVAIGVGVTFEFISGMVKRAPKWMQKLGLEWFWRLIMEPRRLWKRYLIQDICFFGLVLKQKIRSKKDLKKSFLH